MQYTSNFQQPIRRETMSPNRVNRKAQHVPQRAHVASIVLFGCFALPVAIVAILESTFLGIALTAFLGLIWLRLSGVQSGTPFDEAVEALVPSYEDQDRLRSSGNASFDAYREELLDRLEQEQVAFDSFLERLRSAKDKSEFDDFMDDRAQAARIVNES
ncbi:MAG: DUF2852 domain-containing protein [Pseudomonadota bacterium]